MTQTEFDDFRVNLMWYYADLVNKMVDKCQIGTPDKEIDNDVEILSLLEGYIDIMFEYTLFYSNEEDTNFFTIEEMQTILLKINDLLNTNFEISFVKT